MKLPSARYRTQLYLSGILLKFSLKNPEKLVGEVVYSGKIPKKSKIAIKLTTEAQLGNDVRVLAITAGSYSEYLYWNWTNAASSYPLEEPFVALGPVVWLMTNGYDKNEIEIHNRSDKSVRVSVFLARLKS
jgi:hypothetical protein